MVKEKKNKNILCSPQMSFPYWRRGSLDIQFPHLSFWTIAEIINVIRYSVCFSEKGNSSGKRKKQSEKGSKGCNKKHLYICILKLPTEIILLENV